jgi:hypothetical protein
MLKRMDLNAFVSSSNVILFFHIFFLISPPPFFFLKRELSAQVSPEVHHDCALLCSLRGERLDAQR